MSYIKIEVPNDDHIALRAFGKALEEMALAHGAEQGEETLVRARVGEEEIEYLTRDAVAARLRVTTEELQQAAPRMMDEPEVDTTAQQVESLSNKEWPKEQCPVTGAVHDVDPSEVPHSTLLEHGIDSTGTPWDERIHSASKALNSDGTWRLRRKPKDMDEAEWSALVESVKGELQYREQLKEETEQSVTLEDAVNASIEAAHAGVAQEFGTGIANAAFTGDRNEPPVTPPGDDFHTDVDVVTEETVAGIPPLPVPPSTNDWKSEVTHPENGDLCSVCMKPQFSSPGGVTCENGHGGAPAYDKPVPPPVVVAPPVPEVTEWDFPRLMTFLTERHGKIDVATVNTLLAQDGLASLQELNAHPDKIGPFVARVKAHLGE